MSFNWLDIVLLAILLITVILGIIKGLIRQLIGLLTVVIGLILAIYNYSYVGQIYCRLISSPALCNLLGFFTIFVIVLGLGWLTAALLSKLAKGPLKFLNHALGGFLGLCKGILVAGVVVFAFLMFPVNKEVLKESQLAPYCLKMTKAIYYLIPQSLKQEFKKAYQDVLRKEKDNAERI